MKINTKKNIWVILLFLFYIFNIINFFMTSNPYRAYHSGRTAYNSVYNSANFFINPTYILLIILIITYVFLIVLKKRLYYSKVGIFFSILILISAFFNGGIYKDTITNIYNVVSVMLMSSLVSYELHTQKNFDNIKIVWKITILLLFIGIVCAFFQPDRYGIINFNFSRSLRGEITLWLFLGLHIWSVVLSLVIYHLYHKKICILIILLVLFFQFAFANRMGIVILLMPILMYILLLTNTSKKIMLLIILFLVLFFNWDLIWDIFTVGKSSNLASVLNGRDSLWEFYWQSFIQNPIFGSGTFLLDIKNYTGGAFSEIGILKCFGEYGLFLSLFQLGCIFLAFVNSIKYMYKFSRNKNENIIILVMCLFFQACFIPFVLESHARILNSIDFFAWFSMYFLCLKGRSINHKKKKKNYLNIILNEKCNFR